jgi:hypothetical protein
MVVWRPALVSERAWLMVWFWIGPRSASGFAWVVVVGVAANVAGEVEDRVDADGAGIGGAMLKVSILERWSALPTLPKTGLALVPPLMTFWTLRLS